MRILAIGDLPEELAASWGSLVWSDRDPPFDPALLRRAVRLGVPLAEYLGVVAVEGPDVLAQVMVGHHRWTTAHGTEEVAGIENVVTRPDATHRHLATRLLAEVHRREVETGHRLAMLWTRRSWGAHRLYEHLGYRDIYSPPTALLPPGPTERNRLPAGVRVRPARASDAPVLEGLLRRASRGRLGFAHRFPTAFEARFRLGWRAARDHHLLVRDGTPVGYFAGGDGRRLVEVNEGMVLDRALVPTLIDAMRAQRRHRWLGLGSTTLVNDARVPLREGGFVLARNSHATLMAKPLIRAPAATWTELRRTVEDARFVCHRGDMF